MSIPSELSIIDFHLHAFPDKIAAPTLGMLSKTANAQPFTDGTVSGTLAHMKDCGVDLGVLMQIATKPSQQTTVNNWAADVQTHCPGIICFGSVHPDAPDAVEELYRIKELGLKGVKLHPDYQNFFIGEERLFPIYETIAKLRLPVTFHTGRDPVSPDVIHAPAKETARICDAFPGLIMIAAHMGGLQDYDEAERYLVGKNLYLDTSMSRGNCPPEQLLRMIRNHGADKILFATDCPWGNAAEDIPYLKALGLTPDEETLVFHKNGERLLKI